MRQPPSLDAWAQNMDGVLRPDHVPTLEGDLNDNPAYSNLARLHALGYMTGLRVREAVMAEMTL